MVFCQTNCEIEGCQFDCTADHQVYSRIDVGNLYGPVTCQFSCEVECQVKCEGFATCQADCQTICQTNCEYDCELECQKGATVKDRKYGCDFTCQWRVQEPLYPRAKEYQKEVAPEQTEALLNCPHSCEVHCVTGCENICEVTDCELSCQRACETEYEISRLGG